MSPVRSVEAEPAPLAEGRVLGRVQDRRAPRVRRVAGTPTRDRAIHELEHPSPAPGRWVAEVGPDQLRVGARDTSDLYSRERLWRYRRLAFA